MTKFTSRALLFTACFFQLANAADEKPIVFPTGNLAYSIEILPRYTPPPLPEGSTVKREDVPRKVEIVRTEKLLYIKGTLSNGKITEYWQPGKFELTIFQEPGVARLKVRRGEDYLPAVFHLDRKRDWFEWIDAGCLKEEAVSYRGVKCRRYEKTVTLRSEEGIAGTATYQAWIDAATLRPVAFDDGETRYEITFLGPPAEQTLPPLVQQELKEYEALLSPAKRR